MYAGRFGRTHDLTAPALKVPLSMPLASVKLFQEISMSATATPMVDVNVPQFNQALARSRSAISDLDPILAASALTEWA